MGKAVQPVMNESSQPHDRHDRHLVAALAADDLEPIVRSEAQTLVGSCRDCAELLADLRVIAAATAALPQIPRTRDFRITATDAARLRPTGWRGLLDALGGARASFSRPLAVGLTTLGLAGLLATTIPGALSGGLGSAGAAPASGPESNSLASAAPAFLAAPSFGAFSAASAAPAPAASAAASAGAGAQVDVGSPQPSVDRTVQVAATPAGGTGSDSGPVVPGSKSGHGSVPGATDASGAVAGQGADRELLASTVGTTGPSPLLLASLVCLVAGLGLFIVRWGARRLARR